MPDNNNNNNVNAILLKAKNVKVMIIATRVTLVLDIQTSQFRQLQNI